MKKSTILIIENDLKLKESMISTVEKMGHKVLSCARVGDALQILSENKNQSVFVLAKLTMPDLTGVEFLKQARLKNLNIGVCFYAYQFDRNELINVLQYGAIDVTRAPLTDKFFNEKLPKLLKYTVQYEQADQVKKAV